MDYEIRHGDTLSSIAARHGTTIAALLAANPSIKNPNAIRAGAALAIPVTGARSAAPAAPSSSIGSYKGVPITGGSDADVRAQIAAINARADNGSGSGSDGGGNSNTGGNSGGTGIKISSTGDPVLDQMLQAHADVANNLVANGYSIPADLQITPNLISDFLSYAHQVVDPHTQQQISSRLADINANLQNLSTQYGNDLGQIMQDFGTSLATEQNNAGNSGTALSGLRALTENNMAASTNRALSSRASQAATDIGSAARGAAADVGAPNTGGIVLPSLSTGAVSLAGGSRGSSNFTSPLSYSYNPSIYTVGNILSAANTNVNNLRDTYVDQYRTLAGQQSNSGRSMSDLVGMMSGLPSNFTLPTNIT